MFGFYLKEELNDRIHSTLRDLLREKYQGE
jgi:hypothetical protein